MLVFLGANNKEKPMSKNTILLCLYLLWLAGLFVAESAKRRNFHKTLRYKAIDAHGVVNPQRLAVKFGATLYRDLILFSATERNVDNESI
jgi:hypothetical protein